MNTEILSINEKSIEKAAKIITSGGLVAFPTETVYGLGVSAYRGEAVENVFKVKGRPNDNPLICHIGSIEDTYLVSDDVTDLAMKLLKEFAPGPITVVVKKGDKIAKEVTAGLDTVGIRIPELQSARDFISACKEPIAAPSANTSKRPSPTDAKTVFEDIGGKIPLILDDGSCQVGIESTVVDCRGQIPIVLRAGKITCEDIAKVVGECQLAGATSEVRSPGVKYTHYAPKCSMMAMKMPTSKEVAEQVALLENQGETVVVLGENSLGSEISTKNFIGLGESVGDFMRSYYTSLRKAETIGTMILCVVPFSETAAEGLYNRVEKSTGGKII